MINENIRFLIQLVEEKQREIGEVLNIKEGTPFENKKILESAKAHQVSCADAINFLNKLGARNDL